MDKTEEKAIFERATEKLDLYVPTLLKYGQTDYAKEFLVSGGEYVRFPERFASENGLKFLHRDIHLADDDIEIAQEHDIITLRFHEDGLCDIHFNCFTPGGGQLRRRRIRQPFAAELLCRLYH